MTAPTDGNDPQYTVLPLNDLLINDLPQVVFQPAVEFQIDEAERAQHWWASMGVDEFYLDQVHWSRHIAGEVVRHGPSSVLEFGSNCGRNLSAIRQLDSQILLTGIDVNPGAAALGRERGLDVRTGDQYLLDAMPDGSYDVAFTVSVLDHLPDPQPVLAALIRIARTAVILLEPWIGREGKIVRGPNQEAGVIEDIESYAYSWDYLRLIADLAPNRHVSSHPYDLGPSAGLGRWWNSSYHVFTIL